MERPARCTGARGAPGGRAYRPGAPRGTRSAASSDCAWGRWSGRNLAPIRTAVLGRSLSALTGSSVGAGWCVIGTAANHGEAPRRPMKTPKSAQPRDHRERVGGRRARLHRIQVVTYLLSRVALRVSRPLSKNRNHERMREVRQHDVRVRGISAAPTAARART
jgi:hypothetical protein